jgi:hypothetical protein
MKRDKQPGRQTSLRIHLLGVFALTILLGSADGVCAQTQWTTNGNNINNTNPGNVGIGTPSPAAKLDVADTSLNTTKSIWGRLDEGNTTGAGTYLGVQGYSTQPTFAKSFALEHYFYGVLNSTINFYRGVTTTGGFMTFGTGNGTERMRIDGIGNVGIGTISPAVRLHISGDNTAAGGYPVLKLQNTQLNGHTWWLYSGANNAPGAFGLYDETASAYRLFFDATGNAGFGTITPRTKMTIFGGNVFHQYSSTPGQEWGFYTAINNNHVTSNLYFDGQWKMITPGKGSIIATAALSDVAFGVTGENTVRAANAVASTLTSLLTVKMDGSVGIGTSTPNSKLHIVSGTASGTTLLRLDTGVAGGTAFGIGSTINNESYFDLSVYRAGVYTSRFGVDNYGRVYLQPGGGNVGVGTTTPDYKLDVQGGAVNASGGFCIAGDCKTSWSQVSSGNSQWTTNGNNINNANPGNVGIGATAFDPWDTSFKVVGLNTNSGYTLAAGYTSGYGLHLTDRAYFDGTSWRYSAPNIPISNMYLGSGIIGFRVAPGGATGGTFSWIEALRIANTGNVGIGTSNPTKKLEVSGDAKISGELIVDGNIAAKYQDVAEWVPATHSLPTGTVVVLNPTTSNQVMASEQAYDTRVAGVISEKPGLALGEAGADKVLVATTGRVRVKVDATRAPIRVGDLLVTSDKEGLAMKSVPLDLGGTPIHRPGTLIGKALEPLETGVGEILVLLSLQ